MAAVRKPRRQRRRVSAINRYLLKTALLLLPLALVAVATAYLCRHPWGRGAEADTLTSVLAWLALTVGFYSTYAVLHSWRMTRERNIWRDEVRIVEKQAQFTERGQRELQGQIEVLTAMREITRVVSENVEFERILEQVLTILEHLVDAQELAIYLIDEDTGELIPRAHRKGGHTFFGREIKELRFDEDNVENAVEHQEVFRVSDGTILDFAVPLHADRVLLGVVTIKTVLSGSAEQKANAIESLEDALDEIGKHISVAIKTSHLHDRAILDGLTRLYSKHHFEAQLEAHFDAARRNRKRLALIMIDIDHFKSVNDTYGHITGDMILVGVARAIRSRLRKYDTAYRCGGEELALLLPETSSDGAMRIAERVRTLIGDKKFSGENREKVTVTISLGVAELEPSIDDPNQLLSRADQALYEAKRTGRNRTVLWSRALTS